MAVAAGNSCTSDSAAVPSHMDNSSQNQCSVCTLQAWPQSLLSIDVDLVDTNSSYLSFVPAYYGAAAQRVSLVSSTFASGRPSDDEVAGACEIIATNLPWLPVKPCNSRTAFDIHVGRGAGVAPDAIFRDGRVGGTAYEHAATSAHSQSTAAADLASAFSSGSLIWGAGVAKPAAGSLVSVFSESSDLPSCRVPLHQGAPGLFFPRTIDENGNGASAGFEGPVASTVAIRRAAWQENGFSRDWWQPLGLHVTIARGSRNGSLLISFAETAVRLDVGLMVPDVGMVASDGMGTARRGSLIKRSTLYLEMEGRCEHFVYGGLMQPDREPASSFGKGIVRTCEAYNKGARGGPGGVKAVQEWLRPTSTIPAAAPVAGAESPKARQQAVDWTARVCRSVAGTGLHRDLEYTVTVSGTIAKDALASLSSTTTTQPSVASSAAAAQPSTRSACHLAIAQTIPSSLYFDLDETRDQQRGSHLGPIVGGATLRSFARFIDVEKPTSVSTQHVVLLAHPIRSPAGEAMVTAQLAARDRSPATGPNHDGSGHPYPSSFPPYSHYGGANVTTTPSADGHSVDITIVATIKQLLHARYQAPGCTKVNRTEAAAADEVVAGCQTWRDVGWGGVLGERLNSDGSFFLGPADVRNSSSSSSSSSAASPEVDPIESIRPFVPGCYAMAHLPLPTVHLQCAAAPPATEALSTDDGMAILAAAVDSSSGWVQVPVVNTAVPGLAGFDSSLACVAPLAPVPVGYAEHYSAVSLTTAVSTISGALILVVVAWYARNRAGVGAESARAVGTPSKGRGDGASIADRITAGVHARHAASPALSASARKRK